MTLTIHPAAELFPMMTAEELEALAADIAANGLIHPIIVDADKRLIDGRNRLKACQMAGVEPVYEQLDGRDPLSYIVSANLGRRNLTKGQQAMALALIYPEPEKGGRGKNVEARKARESRGFSADRLAQARAVLRQSQDLAEAVMKGAISLDDAIEEAAALRQQTMTAEGKLARLQKHAPDLAGRVIEETLSLDEAVTILAQRDKELKDTRDAGRAAAERILEFVGHVTAIHAALEAGETCVVSDEHLGALAGALRQLQKDMKQQQQR